MTTTMKTIIISSASSVLSSVAVGFLCYVKGKKNGVKETMEKQTDQLHSGSSQSAQSAAA